MSEFAKFYTIKIQLKSSCMINDNYYFTYNNETKISMHNQLMLYLPSNDINNIFSIIDINQIENMLIDFNSSVYNAEHYENKQL